MPMQLTEMWHLVETIEIQAQTVDSDIIQWRVQQFELHPQSEHQKQFRFRVFRYDTFRILPTSRALMGERSLGDGADHDLLVVDPIFDSFVVRSESLADAKDQFLKMMRRQLGYD